MIVAVASSGFGGHLHAVEGTKKMPTWMGLFHLNQLQLATLRDTHTHMCLCVYYVCVVCIYIYIYIHR